MSNTEQFKSWESLPANTILALDDVIDALKFDDKNLIPAIAQQHDTGEVLMLAWMNKESIKESISSGQVCYWSRSRQSYWRKGESSGHVQKLVAMHFDCDGDAILLKVEQSGPACHTLRRSCFYFNVEENAVIVKR